MEREKLLIIHERSTFAGKINDWPHFHSLLVVNLLLLPTIFVRLEKTRVSILLQFAIVQQWDF